MDEVIERDSAENISDAIRDVNVNISLEGWPCAVAVVGVCATVVFTGWLKFKN